MNMESITKFQYDVGDRVNIKAIGMEGRVTGMMRQIDGLNYQVVYWNDGVRYVNWVNDWEIEAKP